MYKGRRILCIIPARGGSRGLPGKNIKRIAGKPMISHSIGKALRIKEIDKLIVTTDDEEIAQVSMDSGAEVPFIRNANLATEKAPIVPVLIDAIDRCEALWGKFDIALMLQANSPLTRQADIFSVIHSIIWEDLDCVFTVTPASHPPQWSLRIKLGRPEFAVIPDHGQAIERRQDEEPLYRSTGAAFALKISALREKGTSFRPCLPARGQSCGVVITDESSAIDIDSELDFYLAETIFETQEK